MSKNLSVDKTELEKFSKLANDWWDKNGPLKTLHDINQERANYIEKFHRLNDVRVLDIGCGGGILAEEMASRGAMVTAIDPEISVINVAKEHASLNNLAIIYKQSTVEEFSDTNFEVITCLEMLEHVQDPEIIIANAKRLLTPGGYLFLSTINRTVKSYAQVILAAEYLLSILPRQTHDFSKFIKPSELCTLLRSYGFELVDISGMSYNPITRKAKIINSIDVNYLLTCRLTS